MKDYNLDINNGVLTLRTSFFKAERGSVLHSGIFNRELASSLAVGALLFLIYLIFRPRPSALSLLGAIALFMPSFIVFRMFVFYEPFLEVTMDKASGTVSVSIKKFVKKEAVYPLREIETVSMGHVVITPENPDGIRVVEKIALQHGTVIPGFGEKKEYYTVELDFMGGRKVMLFSSRARAEAEGLKAEIMKFVETGVDSA